MQHPGGAVSALPDNSIFAIFAATAPPPGGAVAGGTSGPADESIA